MQKFPHGPTGGTFLMSLRGAIGDVAKIIVIASKA